MYQRYEKWVRAMMNSWQNLDGAKTADLFALDVTYYETLDTAPCSSWEVVAKLWEVVPVNQKDIEYSFEVICHDEICGIVNWKMNRKLIAESKIIKQYIDGIFQIKLDDDEKCCFFKQWRFTKTED
jgi:hypothetical protein